MARIKDGIGQGNGQPRHDDKQSLPKKPRVIVTTDGEIDDRSTMIRFLMYVSDFDVEGIIQVNSNAQRSGHSKERWIEAQIEAYRQQWPNLRVHRPDFPSADDLLHVLKVGNENPNDFGKAPSSIDDSEGARHIMGILLDDDPRPVHILAWGGANTQANALWQIKKNHSELEYQRAAAKARLYCIWFQDAAGEFILKHFPEVIIYGAGRPVRDGSWRDVWDYRSVDGKRTDRGSANPKDIQALMDDIWLENHIKKGHGVLGARYPQSYTSEGDTPSFLALVDNGLEQHKDYTSGGWGGRPVVRQGHYLEDGADEHNGKPDMHYTFWRWLPAIQNDWAARADWCIASSFQNANHPPQIRVEGGVVRRMKAGETAILDASSTIDPDGDPLSFQWWQYHEADAATAKVTIQYSDAMTGANFILPDESGRDVHIILEVTDNGKPRLTRYRRIVFHIE